MDASLDAARKNAEAVAEDAEPLRFRLDLAADRAGFERLLQDSPPCFVHDTIRDQLAELVEVLDPASKLGRDEIEARVDAHLAGRSPESYGTWVLYPWSSRLVHVLPREEFRLVRTARNRYKITQQEQDRLYGCRIGVIGLSVGNSAAVTFALEGIGGHFRVADFDVLSLSNLNRLRAGVADLGVNKTVLAAREMYELDPYLEITRCPRGVSAGNMDEFLLSGGRLDLLVEECDDLYVKIVVRERCRALGIPVIMDTSDRGMLDVERFDLEPERPVLHGLIGTVRAEELRGLPTKDKVPIFLAIVGGHRMSTRMAASLPEIDQSIGSWPQLASAVALGGALTADVGRRLLLGEFTDSGRWYVDVEAEVRNGTGEFAAGASPPLSQEIAAEATLPRSLPPPPEAAGEASEAAVRWIVANAVLAPSAHNSQPWEFVWRQGALECRHDPSHDLPSLDFDRCATWATFGAVAETVEMAARRLGLAAATQAFPDPADPRLVCTVGLVPGEHREDELLEFVPRRVTNRRRDGRRPLAADGRRALENAARSRGAELHLLTEAADLEEVGALMGECDRLSTMNRAIHGESMAGFRWTHEEVERHRDGLDVTTLELTPAERAGFWLLSRWEIVECMKRVGGGKALEDLARKSVEASSAVGLLTTAGVAPADYFRGGRALQRMWLTATRHGLALQPWTGLPYLFARLERGGGEGLDEEEVHGLRGLRERYCRLFPVSPGRAEVLLFRLGHAAAPTAISLRRPLERVLTLH